MKASSVELIRQVQWSVSEEQGLKLQQVLDDETELSCSPPSQPPIVETEVEAAKRKVLAAYPKAEAMRTTTYDHKMWYVSTPAQGRKAGGRLSDYRLTEDAAWVSAARHPYVSAPTCPLPLHNPLRQKDGTYKCSGCSKTWSEYPTVKVTWPRK
jgi:hypothetical protein